MSDDGNSDMTIKEVKTQKTKKLRKNLLLQWHLRFSNNWDNQAIICFFIICVMISLERMFMWYTRLSVTWVSGVCISAVEKNSVMDSSQPAALRASDEVFSRQENLRLMIVIRITIILVLPSYLPSGFKQLSWFLLSQDFILIYFYLPDPFYASTHLYDRSMKVWVVSMMF